MADARETGKPEPMLQAEVAALFLDLYTKRLMYQSGEEGAGLDDGERKKWGEVEQRLFDLTVETLPRIRSEELSDMSVEPAPGGKVFYVVLSGGRLRVSMGIETVEAKFPQLREMLPAGPTTQASPRLHTEQFLKKP